MPVYYYVLPRTRTTYMFEPMRDSRGLSTYGAAPHSTYGGRPVTCKSCRHIDVDTNRSTAANPPVDTSYRYVQRSGLFNTIASSQADFQWWVNASADQGRTDSGWRARSESPRGRSVSSSPAPPVNRGSQRYYSSSRSRSRSSSASPSPSPPRGRSSSSSYKPTKPESSGWGDVISLALHAIAE